MLIGAFLGMFTLAGVAVLPNYADAQSTVNWADPNAENNYVSGDGNQTLVWSSLLDTIKNAINWILGILATIALVVCLYGGFLMVTAAGDEKKYQKWLGVLKYAAIGLAIIGLSWMIVSVIFWFVNTLWKEWETASDKQGKVQIDTWGWTSTQWDPKGWWGDESGEFGAADYAQQSAATDEYGNTVDPNAQPAAQPNVPADWGSAQAQPAPQPQPTDQNPPQ